jgi:hypothetical protein
VELATHALICRHGAQNASCNGAFCKVIVRNRAEKPATQRPKTGTIGIDRAVATCNDDKHGKCCDGFEHENLPLCFVDRFAKRPSQVSRNDALLDKQPRRSPGSGAQEHVIARGICRNGPNARPDKGALGVIGHAAGKHRGKNCHKGDGLEHLLSLFGVLRAAILSAFPQGKKHKNLDWRKAARTPPPRPAAKKNGPSETRTGQSGREG